MPSEDRKIPRELNRSNSHSAANVTPLRLHLLHTDTTFLLSPQRLLPEFFDPTIYILLADLLPPTFCSPLQLTTVRIDISPYPQPSSFAIATLFDQNVEGLTKQSFYPLLTPSNLAPDRKIPFEPVKLAATKVSSTPFIRPLLGTVLPVFCGTTTRPP